MLPHDMDEVVNAVGSRIHAGLVSPEVGYQAIGAVAAWRANFPDLALDGMPETMVAAVETELRAAGVAIPWPAHTPDPDHESPGAQPG